MAVSIPSTPTETTKLQPKSKDKTEMQQVDDYALEDFISNGLAQLTKRAEDAVDEALKASASE